MVWRELSIFYSYTVQGKVQNGSWRNVAADWLLVEKERDSSGQSPECSLTLECQAAVDREAGVESLSSLQTSPGYVFTIICSYQPQSYKYYFRQQNKIVHNINHLQKKIILSIKMLLLMRWIYVYIVHNKNHLQKNYFVDENVVVNEMNICLNYYNIIEYQCLTLMYQCLT